MMADRPATGKVEDLDGAFGQITCSFAMQLQLLGAEEKRPIIIGKKYQEGLLSALLRNEAWQRSPLHTIIWTILFLRLS